MLPAPLALNAAPPRKLHWLVSVRPVSSVTVPEDSVARRKFWPATGTAGNTMLYEEARDAGDLRVTVLDPAASSLIWTCPQFILAGLAGDESSENVYKSFAWE